MMAGAAQNSDIGYKSVHVTENSLIEAFVDFAENIEDGGLVYDTKMSVQLLDEFT